MEYKPCAAHTYLHHELESIDTIVNADLALMLCIRTIST